MRGSSLGYLIKEGFRNIRQNRMMSLASILVLLTCMLLIGATVLFSDNIGATLDQIEDVNEISVYLNPEIDPVQKQNIEEDLNSLSGIASIKYISKEDAATSMRDKLGNKAILIDDDVSFFPESYIIKLEDISQMDAISGTIEGYVGVTSVNSTKGLAETLLNIRSLVNIASSVVVILLVIVSLVITGNTIRLTVFNRRKEISIMKYVGATDNFIRLPFIIEGIILGVIAAALAFFITWGYYDYLVKVYQEWATGFLATLSPSIVPFDSIATKLGLSFLLGGFLTGALGSTFFVRKYLKV